jgi:ribosome-binding protein aMBF1 (putative translation factor)
MRKHTKVYIDFFGYGMDSWMPCEICGGTAVDVHHIEARGMGGSKEADSIDNLMGVCRSCHIEYGDKKAHKSMLVEVHNKFLEKHRNSHL